MADHIRQQMLTATVTALTGLTTTGARVYPQRITPLDDTLLPCVLVMNGDERSEFDAMGTDTGRALNRMPRLVIIGCTRAVATSPYTGLNLIAAEVETRMASNATLGGLVDRMELIETNFDVPTELTDKRAGRIALTYRCETRTPAGDPTARI